MKEGLNCAKNNSCEDCSEPIHCKKILEEETSLDWFIENYLPNYNERVAVYLGQCFQNGDEIECIEDLFLYFNIEHFSEALTCYRESILKKSEKEIYKVTDSYGYMNQFEKK
jgi:hypothetical protein